ncbi:MAG: hypothetical protein KC656_36255, partial [Myxococcales bacterium]|nr:hypothetical protein [Myxococcales bacterium]
MDWIRLAGCTSVAASIPVAVLSVRAWAESRDVPANMAPAIYAGLGAERMAIRHRRAIQALIDLCWMLGVPVA